MNIKKIFKELISRLNAPHMKSNGSACTHTYQLVPHKHRNMFKREGFKERTLLFSDVKENWKMRLDFSFLTSAILRSSMVTTT